MTIILTQNIRVAGAVRLPGEQLSLAADLESDLVQRRAARWVGSNPNIPVDTGQLLYASNAPSQHYQRAFRSAQAGFGPLIDQGPLMLDAGQNTAVFPAAFATRAYVLGEYVSPTVPNGILYRCTTAGTTTTEPSWNLTIGGTSTSGTATFTAERGPWFVDAGGVRQFRSILNTQLGVPGSFSFGEIPWDMALGDSLIFSVTSLQNYTSGPTNFNETAVAGSRVAGGGTSGVALVATGQTTFNDLRFRFSDTVTTRTVAHLASGAANKPGDGNRRTSTFFVDGITKRMYYCSDGAPRNAPADYTGISATDVVAWDADVSAVTGSTRPAVPFFWGALPQASGASAATTFEIAASRIDMLVMPSRGLPADIISLAQWFHNRGEGLLPASLLA